LNNQKLNKMKKKYYQLYHEYQEEDEEIIKFIGVFSSKVKAKEAIEYLIKQSGFKDYPKKCFVIGQDEINTYWWKDGFCSWGDAYEEFNKND